MNTEALNIEFWYPTPGTEHVTVSDYEKHVYDSVARLSKEKRFKEARAALFSIPENRRSSFPFLRVQLTIEYTASEWATVKAISKLLAKRFKYIPGYHYWTIAELRLGNYQAALRIIDRCLKRNPWDCSAKWLECALRGAVGDIDGAFEAWRQTIVLAGSFPGKSPSQHAEAVRYLMDTSPVHPMFKPIADKIRSAFGDPEKN